MNLPGRGRDGNSELVREALARAGEPLSIYKLQLATGLEADKVRTAIKLMVHRGAGGVVALPGDARHGTKVYTLHRLLPKPEPKRGDGPYAIAGPITIPQYRWHGVRAR